MELTETAGKFLRLLPHQSPPVPHLSSVECAV